MTSKEYIDDWKSQAKTQSLTHYLDRIISKQSAEIDKVAQSVSNEIEQEIDCLACGNCCRSSVTTFTTPDISRAAKYLNISKKQFIKKYLIKDNRDDSYITMNTPCPMLNADNTCQIYEVRPAVCSSFPHTHRDNFKNRIHAHKANLKMCPITYAIVDRLDSVFPI